MDTVLELKQKLQTQGIEGLALDIDETLSDSHPYWFDYLWNFHTPPDITREEAIEKYREGTKYFPGWRTDEAKEHINKALHSQDFNESIPLLEESNAMVRKLQTMIPVVVYITARWETVRPATSRWLKQHGFPDVELVMNPLNSTYETRNAWKASVLKELYPEVMGIVDDSPELPDALRKLDYEGKVFVYGKQVQEIKPEEYPFEVILSPNWDHVLDYFQSKKLV